MNLAPQHIEAEPAPSSRRPIGSIWLVGGIFYHQMPGGAWDLPITTTWIERDDHCELLRFGLSLLGDSLLMPLLTSDGATAAEIEAARVDCLSENRYEIRRLLQLDDVDWAAVLEGFDMGTMGLATEDKPVRHPDHRPREPRFLMPVQRSQLTGYPFVAPVHNYRSVVLAMVLGFVLTAVALWIVGWL